MKTRLPLWERILQSSIDLKGYNDVETNISIGVAFIFYRR